MVTSSMLTLLVDPQSIFHTSLGQVSSRLHRFSSLARLSEKPVTNLAGDQRQLRVPETPAPGRRKVFMARCLALQTMPRPKALIRKFM